MIINIMVIQESLEIILMMGRNHDMKKGYYQSMEFSFIS